MAKYSIILPVRNGIPYVKECIASIFNQTHKDYNIVILDNASTDGTSEWLQSLNDHRIAIYPSSSSLSIEENWGRIKTVPRSDFMTMIGHDDVLDSNYLETIDKLVQKHPDASLYQTHFRYIDSKGAELKKCMPMREKQLPHDVLINFLGSKMDIMGTGFMMRSRDYDQVGGMPSYPNLLFADMELWIELSRKGYLAVAQEECFSYRLHPGATTSTSAVAKALTAFDRFVNYLEKVKKEDDALGATISSESHNILQQYCQGITHKVLRIPKNKRDTPSVAMIIDQFREYGKRLIGDKGFFEPLNSSKIRMGKMIDNNPVFHSLFLLFKKVYNKPVFSK